MHIGNLPDLTSHFYHFLQHHCKAVVTNDENPSLNRNFSLVFMPSNMADFHLFASQFIIGQNDVLLASDKYYFNYVNWFAKNAREDELFGLEMNQEPIRDMTKDLL